MQQKQQQQGIHWPPLFPSECAAAAAAARPAARPLPAFATPAYASCSWPVLCLPLVLRCLRPCPSGRRPSLTSALAPTSPSFNQRAADLRQKLRRSRQAGVARVSCVWMCVGRPVLVAVDPPDTIYGTLDLATAIHNWPAVTSRGSAFQARQARARQDIGQLREIEQPVWQGKLKARQRR